MTGAYKNYPEVLSQSPKCLFHTGLLWPNKPAQSGPYSVRPISGAVVVAPMVLRTLPIVPTLVQVARLYDYLPWVGLLLAPVLLFKSVICLSFVSAKPEASSKEQ
jgi:hypothetical protein